MAEATTDSESLDSNTIVITQNCMIIFFFRYSRQKDEVKGRLPLVGCLCSSREDDYYPDINSSPTSTTLSDGTTGCATGSNYSLKTDLEMYRGTPAGSTNKGNIKDSIKD